MSAADSNPPSSPLATPVVLLVFNRPESTAQVLAEISKARPRRLYVVADGPRAGRDDDVRNCEAVRSLIARGIDWPCDVQTDYAPTNLGCGRRVASGIDWVFTGETEAIFLEDDCRPHPTFFAFCAELLARYRDDVRVAQICGSPIVAAAPGSSASYHFSRYGPVWGWASWRRAWTGYDIALRDWPDRRRTDWLQRTTLTQREARLRRHIYDELHAGRIDTWDYQWGYTKLARGQWSVIPAVNLIDNIGGGPGGTHQRLETAAGPARAMRWPLLAPPAVEADADYDRAFSEHIAPAWGARIRRRLRSLLRR